MKNDFGGLIRSLNMESMSLKIYQKKFSNLKSKEKNEKKTYRLSITAYNHKSVRYVVMRIPEEERQ